MGGAKVFNNQTDAQMSFVLYVRAGENPANYAGTVSVDLAPRQSKTVEYGDATNIYLNGYLQITAFQGELWTRQEVVTTRGGPLDNEWNTNKILDITFQNGAFSINAHN